MEADEEGELSEVDALEEHAMMYAEGLRRLLESSKSSVRAERIKRVRASGAPVSPSAARTAKRGQQSWWQSSGSKGRQKSTLVLAALLRVVPTHSA